MLFMNRPHIEDNNNFGGELFLFESSTIGDDDNNDDGLFVFEAYILALTSSGSGD